jgi:glycerol-3-phosphate dehydrogenase
VAANYTEVARFIHHKGRVLGVDVVDKLGAGTFEVRGRTTLNAAGGWAPHLYRTSFGGDPPSPMQFSRDLCLVLDRSFNDSYALAVLTASTDPDALVSRSSRHLLLAPWCGHTLLGVWHSVMTEHPDRISVAESEVEACLDEANAACPGLRLSLDDVTRVQSGPVLINRSTGKQVRFGTRSHLLDHAEHGIDGLLTLVGVRYTVARHDAERVVDLLFRKLGREPVPSRTAQTPIFGGAIEDIDRHRQEARTAVRHGIAVACMDDLALRYGSEHQRVVAFADTDRDLARCLGDSNVLGAEVAHAVREEMAQTLSDIALRRTELATAGAPSDDALREAAACAARLLAWDEARVASEVESVRRSFAFGQRE